MIASMQAKLRNDYPALAAPLQELKSAWRHRQSKRHFERLTAAARDLRLELGGGDRPGTSPWLTVDMTPNCDLFWDLRKPLPVPDESVEAIYTAHLLEHLSYEEGQRLLAECKRLLRTGGWLSVCVPNARLYIEAYLDRTRELPSNWFGYTPAFNRTTRIDVVNYTAYMNGLHKYMFDSENLLFILRSQGFRRVAERHFDPLLDAEARRYESIYAIAEK